MTLDPLDPNSEDMASDRSIRASRKKSNESAIQRSNANGELFRPHEIGNQFNWDADVWHKNEDNQQREGGEHLEPVDNVSSSAFVHHDEKVHPQRPMSPHTQVSTAFEQQEPPQPQEVMPHLHDGEQELPTWRRKFSLIPGGFSAGPDSSTRWKEWKQALKFGKPRKSSVVAKSPAPKRPQLDESEEAARIRASNMVTCLIAGSPAALILASNFLKDEHGTRRAPLLLNQLAIELEDVSRPGSKHTKYRINLEYGIGSNRLKWHVIKDLRDLVSLHSRLKVAVFQSKSLKGFKHTEIPKFPKVLSKDMEPGRLEHPTFNETYLSTPKPTSNRFDVPRPSQNRRHGSLSSGSSDHSGGLVDRIHRIASRMSISDERGIDNDREQFRKKIENYLNQLILAFALKAEANRLFQFFELSPIGVLLSYEHGFQGKQGYMIVGSSSKAQGWRVGHWKFSDIKQMVQRHTYKWFLVRDSYIMYVSDIYSTTPLDVFLVDSSFKITYHGEDNSVSPLQFDNDNESFYDDTASIDESKPPRSGKTLPHVVIKLENGERELKMIAKSKNQAIMWAQSIQNMQKNTIWSSSNRFNSFAPVRENCFAQWLVDGRDHFWALSSALEMATDVIYIHDWWLSPEIYMRRPANGNQEWRLDRILKRKAEEGVKVFVIVYRNVGTTVVTDSLWTKHSLIDLHPNVHVLRSPNQWLQNTFFWAHHEKLCIVDHAVAFVGGIDLCFGRYDTPDHVLVDDSPYDFGSERDASEQGIRFQTFPGKDYSNPRVKDFYDLDKPYESMYDRQVVPRMPWHDVHMMVAGEPARDLARHFVQRWNYLLRQKRPSRPTPLLIPPTSFTPVELEKYDLAGTCEVQLLRSSGNWSLGLQKHEQSIQNAYLKIIETSEHYVYLENQFFITASAFDGTVIENRIGDALVDRIIRAHNEKKKWKAIIVIPLMPGFESQVDEAEGSSVRVIMQCQYQSISRGTTSIFAKLKKMKINPYDYIQFYSLRKWGRIGPDRTVVSEQLYIHAKIIISDDRTALIGSANINERSQRGNRDSEVAAIVRDTELVNTTMDGKPYKAGKFAHTLRMRLMREHLGIDVDILDIVERRFSKIEQLARETKTGQQSKTHNFSNKDHEVQSSMVELASRDVLNMPSGTDKWKKFWANSTTQIPTLDKRFEEINKEDDKKNIPEFLVSKSHDPVYLSYHSFNNRAREQNVGIRDKKPFSSDSRVTNNEEHKLDVEGEGVDKMKSKAFKNYKLNAAKTLKKWATESLVNDATDVFLPHVEQVLEFLDDDELISDPSKLTNDQELALAERNQERWNMLKRIAYLQRVAAKQKLQVNDENIRRSKSNLPPLDHSGVPQEGPTKTGTLVQDAVSAADLMSRSNDQSAEDSDLNEIQDLPGENIPVINLSSANAQRLVQSINDLIGEPKFQKFIDPYCFGDPLEDAFYEDVWFNNAHRNTILFREVFHCQPDDTVATWKDYQTFTKLNTAFSLAQKQQADRRLTSKTSDSNSETSTVDDKISSPRRDSVRLEDIEEVSSVEGILGNAPPPHTDSGVDSSGSSDIPKRGKSGEYAFRKRSPLGADRVFDRETADRILSEVQGHLVLFPTDWLWKEIEGGNWFYNMDRLPPIEIYD
ncbi:unnamed protein product [Cyberlindnera jadinii]|uniref:Phospholipase n=1 Tax=Cyberlindnera jadinii (strain ATCC 18201 / CBS 1600 / BCRC 20928 / JCM 3617 / NBRC 0987 / NRRL Y-1542) TaxID=983966 RepID=A0A0H5BYZ8_CYBJN|nr:unnamed protein product [Cyberlindnera jadinii]